MSRSIFAARVRTNPYGVFLVNEYESKQIGTSPTGVAETALTSSDNSVIQFGSKLYFNGGGVLHRYNSSTNNWDVLYHPNGMSGTSRRTSGLYSLNISNVPHLVWIVNPFGSTLYRAYKYNLLTNTATEVTGTYASATIENGSCRSILYKDKIFWQIDYTNLYTIVYDIGAGTIGGFGSSIGAGNADCPKPNMCIWNKDLFTMTKAFAGSTYLMRYNGSSWTHVMQGGIAAIIASDSLGGSNTQQAACLFTDKTNLYVIYLASGTIWKLVKVDPYFNVTALINILPFEMAITSSASRAWVYIDSEDNIDNPEIFIYFCFSATAGTSVTKYKWNGPTSAMTSVGVAGDTIWSWSSSGEGAGHRSYSTNEIDININRLDTSTIVGATRIYFNTYESDTLPIGSPIHVKFALDEDFEHPSRWCSLINPLPSGTIINGDTITGIVVNSGINYTVDWRPAIDGISANQAVTLTPWISGVI